MSLPIAHTIPGTLMRSAALAFSAVLALATAASAAPPLPPRPTKYATDHAQAFDAARLHALNERLATFERETSNQVIVYVDRKIPSGTTLEELSSGAMRAWGVGQKGKRNGVALFVFVDDRKMRIEVGYGLEGALPDAAAHRITDTVIKPHFKKGDYAAGIEAGANAILAAVAAERNKGTGVTAAEKARGAKPAGQMQHPPTLLSFLCPLAMLIPLVLWWITRRPLPALAWGSLIGTLVSLAIAIAFTDGLWLWGGVSMGLLSFGAFVVMFVRWLARNAGSGSGAAAASTSTWGDSSSSSWSSSDSSSSSDSGSSSDFSGGGGDSGGGGSSDSW